MSRLLASVKNIDEARLVLQGGADIIDLKNPVEGALGALPITTIRDIVAMVDGRKPVSATVGDLPMNPTLVTPAVRDTAAAGVDIVKIGLFGREGHRACIDAMRPLSEEGIRIVAVLFADDRPDFTLLDALAEAGFYGAMLDTANKDGRRLTDHLPLATLHEFVARCHRHTLLTGLAGSLRMEDIPELQACQPDYLGFRGALCSAALRQQALEPARLAAVREVLYSCNTEALIPG